MDKVLFSSDSTEWGTPWDLFNKLNRKFNFTIDVCANEFNHKCDKYYNIKQNGLSKKWFGNVWCNPPYGREIKHWVKKAYDSSRNGKCLVVMLIPARTDTEWFHRYIYKKEGVKILFLRGRLKFTNNSGNILNSAPFPSMLVLFNRKEE